MNTAGGSSVDATALGVMSRLAQTLLAQNGAELSYSAVKGNVRELLVRDPLDSLLVITLGGSYLFYLAEKDRNEKVTSIWDAVVFITTCFSVGYDDVFARTSSGKAIASFVMTVGPALAAKALDPPQAPAVPDESLAVQKAILAKLEAILAALPESDKKG